MSRATHMLHNDGMATLCHVYGYRSHRDPNTLIRDEGHGFGCNRYRYAVTRDLTMVTCKVCRSNML